MRVRMRLYLQSFYARRVMMSRCRERLKVPPQHTWVWELESVGSSGLIRGTSAGGDACFACRPGGLTRGRPAER